AVARLGLGQVGVAAHEAARRDVLTAQVAAERPATVRHAGAWRIVVGAARGAQLIAFASAGATAVAVFEAADDPIAAVGRTSGRRPAIVAVAVAVAARGVLAFRSGLPLTAFPLGVRIVVAARAAQGSPARAQGRKGTS